MSHIGSKLSRILLIYVLVASTANSLSSDCPSGVEDTRIDWQGKNWAHSCQFADNNFLLEKTNNAETCEEMCHLTPSCTHYSWSNWENGTCWLKNGSVHRCNARFNGANTTRCGIVRSYDHISQTSRMPSIFQFENSTPSTNPTKSVYHEFAKESSIAIQSDIRDPFIAHISLQPSSKKMIEVIQNSSPSNLISTRQSIPLDSNQTLNEMPETYSGNGNGSSLTNQTLFGSPGPNILRKQLNSSSCSNSTILTKNQTSFQTSTSSTKLINLAQTTKNPFLHFWYEPLLRAKPHSQSSSFILKNMEFINKHPFLLFVFGMTTVLFICLISIGVILLSNEHMPRQTSNLKKINCLTA